MRKLVNISKCQSIVTNVKCLLKSVFLRLFGVTKRYVALSYRYKSNFNLKYQKIMKTLKAMMMGLALLFVCGISQAAPTGHANATKDQVIDIYLNAIVHGKLDGISDAIDDDAQFSTQRGDLVNTLTKSQILESMQANANIEQQCECTKSVLQDDDEKKVMKVNMKYADYTRTDIVTAEPEGKGWKITKVETSFK